MTDYVLIDVFGPYVQDANGAPLVNGSIEAFIAGTSTPTPIYFDAAGSAYATSVKLNSLGRPQTSGGTATPIYADASITYKFVVKDAYGTPVPPTIEPYNPAGSAGVADKGFTSVAQLQASSGNGGYETIYIESYYAVTYPSSSGPYGGHYRHRTSTTGTPGSASGAFVFDADGVGWKVSARNRVTPAIFGCAGDGTDESTELQYAVDFANDIYIDRDYTFSSLTIPADKTFSGPGTLIGLEPTGSKPTRANLTSVDNSSARLALLTGYYNATVTFSTEAKIYGELRMNNALWVASGGAEYVDVRGIVTMDNVSCHGIGLYQVGGFVDSTAGMIISDAADKAVQCSLGGKLNGVSAVIVSAVGRSLECATGGHIFCDYAQIFNGGDEGVYTNCGGNISIFEATVYGCAGEGILTNYGGNIIFGAGTVTNCTGTGISSESGGQVYAPGAIITNNGLSGIFATYGGTVQATGATITGNTLFAIDCRGNAVVNALTAIINTSNNSGGVQIRTIQGGVIYAEQPGIGTGKTGLSADDYDPPWQIDGPAGSYIGETDPVFPGCEIGSIYPKPIETTIASGVLTISGFTNSVETESAASTDDVTTIEFAHGLNSWAMIYPVSTSRDVVIKHGTGNITTSTGADITLDSSDKGAIVTKVGSAVYVIPLF